MNWPLDSPKTFRTVSEFRSKRSAETSMPQISQAASPRQLAAEKNSVQQENIGSTDFPALQIEQNHKAPPAAARPAFEFDEQQATIVQADDGASIRSALAYFDTECTAEPLPSAFEADRASSSSLAQFMSRSIDMESAFKYLELENDIPAPSETMLYRSEKSANPPARVQIELSGQLRAELEADDGNGLVEAVSAAGVDTQELPVPDEPALASCRMIDQAAVLKDPQEASSVNSSVERDENGRVVRALFYGGESVLFKYDQGALVELSYANMVWKPEEAGWGARDRQTEYFVEGKISVLENGFIRIEREDITRTLKHSGTRIDEHRSGSRTESRKLKNKPSPYDLLAKAKPVNSIWLSSKSMKNSSEQARVSTPLTLDLVDNVEENQPDSEQQKTGSGLIPPQAKADGMNGVLLNPANLSCVPSTPIELRSLERNEKLRSLEDELLDSEASKKRESDFALRCAEFWLKSCLWLTDRLSGQSSPKHLMHLDCLAKLYFQAQKNDLAELTHLRALHIREQHFGKNQPELACSLRGLAAIYEARGNFQRAEEMYKDAISLEEGGLRRAFFLYSEKVIGAEKLGARLSSLFSTVSDLARLYCLQKKQSLSSLVYEKAVSLYDEILEREPSSEPILMAHVDKHIETMKEICL